MTSPMVGPGDAVMVTGGAQRVGAELSLRFARAGFDVVIHCNRSEAAAQALKAQILAEGARADVLAADLADWTAVEALVSRALEMAPKLKVLVNCAAVFDADTARSPDPRHWRTSQAVNALAPAKLSADFHAGVHLGVVINVLDQKLANPNPDYFSYTAAKAALAEVTRLQAMAFAPNTLVVGLAPGLLLPSADQTEEEHKRSSIMNLLGRTTSPCDLAGAALMAATGVLKSGEILYVDSGQHLVPQRRDVMFLSRGET